MVWDNWLETVRESAESALSLTISYLPKLLGAILLVLAGYLLARIVGAGTAGLLKLVGLDRLLANTPIQALFNRSGSTKSGSDVLGLLVFWAIFLVFGVTATDMLGLPTVSATLTDLAHYLPKVGLAVLIIVLGMLAASYIKELISLACASAGIAQGTIVAQTFYVAAILVVFVTAVNELGIDTTLLNSTIMIGFGGLIAGAALSFGLGARGAVANLIAAHYLRQVFRVGQTIRVGDIQGTIAALTPVAIVVDTPTGRVVLPASRFQESSATIESEV